MDEVESVDHPLSPPTTVPVTEEYIKEKKLAIKTMVDSNININNEEKKQLTELLCRHHDRFSLAGENMEKTSTAVHEIDTGNNRPFRERLRTYSPSVQEILDAEVRRFIKDGIIQPSRSPYASNLLLVRKPDPSAEGGIKNRVCASFVKLNEQTVKDSYPLPNIQVIFDKLGASKWFTTMDLLNGFWQVMIKEEHRHKTAFITARGLFEFIVMPFGLCNAPATFQRLMDTVIKPEYRSFIETYIDDVMIHSKTFKEHLVHLDILLTLLKEHNLVVKLKKCKFAQLAVKFLGHILSHGHISTNPEAVATILKWERPADTVNKKKAVRGFLGMVGWYRKFIPNFSHVARPLFQLLKKEAVWDWTDECQQAFIKLRDAISKGPVLAIADPNKEYVLQTDASDFALGAILQQADDDGHLHPIAYASKTLNPAECRYSTTDREALAIPWALEHFNTYCEGHKYTALTDHAALRYMMNNKDKTPRMHRMVARLSPYEITLYYKPGSENHAADLLSRESQYMHSSTSSDNSATHSPTTSTHSENIADMQPITHHMLRRSNRLSNLNNSDLDDDNVSASAASTSSNNNKLAKKDENKQVEHDEKQHSTRTHSKKKKKERLTAEEYEVEKIVDRRIKSNTPTLEYEYRVRWKGYDEEDDTWQSLSSLKSAMKLVVAYEKERQEKEIGTYVLSHPTIECDECGERCNNATALLLHRYQQHKVAAPVTELIEMMPSDRQLIIQLQRQEQEFKYIYASLNIKVVNVNKDEDGVNIAAREVEEAQLTKTEQKSLYMHEYVVDEEGMLYCIDIPTLKSRVHSRVSLRLCVPTPLRQQVLHAMHTNKLAAHPGIVRMTEKMRMYVWWPSMLTDIIKYVSVCTTCQQVKRAQRYPPPQAVRLAVRPWQQIAIDAVGPLPVTKNNNQYIIDVVDHFTRYIEGWAVPEIDMASIAKAIIDKIICRYGLFEVLISDRGSVFTGTLIAHVYKLLRIHKVTTTAYHPQSNGMIEVFHRTLKQTLKLWSLEYEEEWDDLLPFAIFAYNTAYHTTLQEVPHFLNHGYDARLPIDSIISRESDEYTDVHEYAASVVDKLHGVYDRVRTILKEVNENRSENEAISRILQLQIGDEVYMYDPTTSVGESGKLKVRWTGPYTVLSKQSAVVYVINKDGKSYSVNIDRLKKAKNDNNNNNNDSDSHKDNVKMQLQQLESSLHQLNDTQQLILQRQQMIEVERERLQQQQRDATAVAIAEVERDDDDHQRDEDEIAQVAASTITYLHTNYINWC